MKCKNCDEKYYTGKENTPLGRGYSAAVEKVGTKMKGRDGKMYVVKKYKNGKRWTSSKIRHTSPRANAVLNNNQMITKQEAIDTILDYCNQKEIPYTEQDLIRMNEFAIIVPYELIEYMSTHNVQNLKQVLDEFFGDY